MFILQIPMYAVGQSDQETPFTFGSARPSLLFTWSVNNKDVVVLNNVFHKVRYYIGTIGLQRDIMVLR